MIKLVNIGMCLVKVQVQGQKSMVKGQTGQVEFCPRQQKQFSTES